MIMLVWYVVIVFGASRGKGCLAIDCWAIPPPMWQLARARDPCTCHDHWGKRLCTGGQTAHIQHYSPRQQCLAPETPPRVQQVEIRVIVRQLR